MPEPRLAPERLVPAKPGEIHVVNITAEEYKLVYIPIMMGVYTARHKKTPPSEGFLFEHIFGSDPQSSCDECREETELIVSHQKKFA